MSQTFIAQSNTLSAFASDTILPSVAMDERNPHRAHLALFNTTGSGQVVRIRDISVFGSWAGTTVNTQKVVPITSHSGGEPFYPAKVDSNNASFPSTVEIKLNAIHATVATGSLTRVQRFPNALLGVTAGYKLQWKNASLHGWSDSSTAQVQKYSLRNGQGLGIQEGSAPNAYLFPIEVNAIIRLSDTGACYYVTAFTCAGSPFAFTVLNNGYTAGQVEIIDLRFNSARGGTSVASTADINPTIQVALLEGYNATNNGTVVTPLTMDTTNSLNSGIKVYKDVDVGYFYARTGNLATNALFLRNMPQTAPQTAPMFTPARQNIYKSNTQYTDIVIKEGSGIAVLLPTQGALNSTFCIDMTFTQESTTAGAVYPTVGNVDLSIQYGPNGTDYTGTLVQPATTNVLSGVTYGAGGTEFTGTATAGEGGFISIVNE